ncbi:nucleotidyltransferase family protein [Rhodoferax sp. TBRC 17660]|uniref:Nucleotidyltransferase family protein n=1 Tax=Rhodoferax potami TaxID=3068338 RepID=A0ABU3KS62_9BURK|nr:nucleotidyltransferase family protein [Rhodoferax sp. TBRC 17660]MDT7520067.1 nucleotidyltransferase family protein [Rhodoferax sp. TBRC 17660]
MNQWKRIAVPKDTPLETAIATLDEGGQRIVLVVDDDERLQGTLTDGDVRRALLRHQPLTTPVGEVMCIRPQVAQLQWSREKILSVMESTRLLHLPVVDAVGRVVGLETLHELLDKKPIDNPVFLMAGGFGKRLYPLTQDCPKPMLKVGDKPILELILQSLADVGFHRFYISTHYLPEMIRDYFGDGSRWGVSIQYVHEDVPLGTGGALGLLPRGEVGLPMILMNGDLLTRVDYRSLLEFHQRHQGAATLCVREYESQVPYGVIQSEGHRITQIVEKPVQRFFISAGIYVLSPELIGRVVPGERIDMPTLLEQEIVAGRDVNMFPVHEYWLDIGRMDDFHRAQEEVRL